RGDGRRLPVVEPARCVRVFAAHCRSSLQADGAPRLDRHRESLDVTTARVSSPVVAALQSAAPILIGLAIIAGLSKVIAPIFGDYVSYVLLECAVSGVAAVSLNIVLGLAGQ